LEAMQELQATVEGSTSKLPFPFMVIATQNPMEFDGVYPLPENQKDRFMIRVEFKYPAHDVEVEILKRNLTELKVDEIQPVIQLGELQEIFKVVDSIKVSDEILDYISRLANETRVDTRVSLGASPRAIVQLLQVARANAALDGRTYLTPDDVKKLANVALAHRIRLDRAAALKGLVQDPSTIVQQVLDVVKPPR
ncbi:MAG: AAA family ATPase, partial [Nitrososphaerales archaeon]